MLRDLYVRTHTHTQFFTFKYATILQSPTAGVKFDTLNATFKQCQAFIKGSACSHSIV